MTADEEKSVTKAAAVIAQQHYEGEIGGILAFVIKRVGPRATDVRVIAANCDGDALRPLIGAMGGVLQRLVGVAVSDGTETDK